MRADHLSFLLEHESMSAPSTAPGLTVQEQRGSLNLPFYDGVESDVAFLARAQRTEVGKRLHFNKTGIDIPDEFGAADFGFAWSDEDMFGNRNGLSATLGNAGTRLVSGDRPPIVAATFTMERKKVGHSWIYFLAYSNNRTILNNIPIPGFAYAINAREYTAVFGLPFVFANWRLDSWSFTGALSPFGAMVDGGLRFLGPWQIFTGVAWSPRSYQNLVEGREERLIFDKKELDVGFRFLMGPRGSLTAAYAYHFDRRFLLGKSLTENIDSLALADSGGFQVKLRLAF
jgi:hypothetical protein